jgi:hypothetical protein
MDDFQDWIMTLPKQKLTEQLKIEILAKAHLMLQVEIVNVLKNMSTK